MNYTALIIVILFMLIAFIYVQNMEGLFVNSRYNPPYYTTTFQAYPGKYMNFSSARESKCLQNHQSYAGYRNCMLYLQ